MFIQVRVAQACDQIVQQIEHMIVTGSLRPGERFPSERSLAKQFGVSRMTLRRAMQQLEVRGLVETRSGRGTFVSRLEPQMIAPALVTDIGNAVGILIENGR